ncbi:hypothetical protein GW17_00052218 [Ensete ventricosum]|nr:hypothetical protein GW17_00052218 [Ensete ventricosum]
MCTGEWPSHGDTEDCMRTLMQAGQSHGDDHGAEGVGTGRRMMGGLRCGQPTHPGRRYREKAQRHGAAKAWADDMDAGAEPCSDVTSFLYLKSAFLAMEPAHFLISLARSPLSLLLFLYPSTSHLRLAGHQLFEEMRLLVLVVLFQEHSVF